MDDAEYYRGILDNLPGGFLSVDLKGCVAYLNPMAGRILHLPAGPALIGQEYFSVLADFPALRNVVREALETRKTVYRAELSVLHGDVPLIIGYSTLHVKNRTGECLGVGVIFQDITSVGRAKR